MNPICTRALILLLALTAFRHATADDFEYPGLVDSAEFSGELALVGADYRVRDQATVVDYYARFVIESDYGVIVADGADMLQLRLRELEALRTLEAMSVGRVMVESGGRRLRRPVDQVDKVAAHPTETVKGMPAGIGRYLLRGAERVGDVALDIADAARDRWGSDGSAQNPANQSSVGQRGGKLLRRLALREIGYQKVRRGLARHLGVDPYSSNPLLRDRLDDLAWAAWSADKGASLGLGAVISGPLDSALDIAGDAHELVWENPPEKVEKRNQRALRSLSLSGKPVRDFLRNGAFNPLQQTAFVDLLTDSAFSTIRPELLAMGTAAANEREARYLIDLLNQLRALAKQSAGLPRVGIVGPTPVLDSGDGRLWIVLPVDYVAWTELTAGFALREDLLMHRPTLLVRGKVSERALHELLRAGWRVEQERG